MADFLEMFRRDLQLHGYSESTQESYLYTVKRLCAFTGKDPERITEADVRAYFLHLKNDLGRSESYLRISYSAVKFFFTKTMKKKWRTLEAPILEALAKRIRQMGQVESLRAQVKAFLAESGAVTDARAAELETSLRQIQHRIKNWQAAIDGGVDIALATENLNRLARERDAVVRELELARATENLDSSLETTSREILAGLDRMQEILESGTVAEVKAALRAYIGRIEYDHEKEEARVGFLKIPTRAVLKDAQTARLSILAGAGFDTDPSSSLDWVAVSPGEPFAVPA